MVCLTEYTCETVSACLCYTLWSYIIISDTYLQQKSRIDAQKYSERLLTNGTDKKITG